MIYGCEGCTTAGQSPSWWSGWGDDDGAGWVADEDVGEVAGGGVEGDDGDGGRGDATVDGGGDSSEVLLDRVAKSWRATLA